MRVLTSLAAQALPTSSVEKREIVVFASKLIIALEQIALGPSWEDNLSHCLAAIRRAAASGAQVAVLPEACMRPYGLPLQDPPDGLYEQWRTAIQACAQELDILVLMGLFRRKNKALFNTLLVTGHDLSEGYDKRHLYDAFGYAESSEVSAGSDCLILDLGGFSLGFALCYDLRFPEHFIAMALQGANVMIVCADWAQGPGKLEQWRLLAQARALDCTSYLLACGQACNDWQKGFGLGHSLVVHPSGQILEELGEGEGELVLSLDGDEITRVREALPVLSWRHRHSLAQPGIRRVRLR